MASKAIRKRYFVNFSIQFKYIMISVLPFFTNEPALYLYYYPKRRVVSGKTEIENR